VKYLPGEDQIENVGAPNHIHVEIILVVTNEECLLTTPVLQVSSNWKIFLRVFVSRIEEKSSTCSSVESK